MPYRLCPLSGQNGVHSTKSLDTPLPTLYLRKHRGPTNPNTLSAGINRISHKG
jgi:hypothetical protein